MFVHREAVINRVRLHYVEAGTGPLVVLLHGFPEFWFSWRYQIPALAAAGYRVIAPDLRGYNTSDKPAGLEHYRIDVLAEDVIGLIRHAGGERAALVGHDWGGAIAWATAWWFPEMLDRLVILNAPHPRALARELRTLSQLRRSSYMFFFLLPWLPERALAAGDFAIIRRLFARDPRRPEAFSRADIERYVEALRQPGALTAMLNYYRAGFRRRPRRSSGGRRVLDLPTLVIWGEHDRYLGLPLLDGLDRWVSNLRIERIAEASHWVQMDAPERVNELIIQFLAGPPRRTSPTPSRA